ncbi:PRC-barrel domain-containing protein [Citreimonas salinaria]|uniref:PRC-barrel domain-containing protein n=1 Tax=Citreimonas salinaria TaxID=321339 RepID=A0A1H3NDV1_9RHOB|nr:PRC-barrel domain-containing protein [Citreimonas salinaria]SDY87072.1 PRC-barrel domain-containing protein [Citreimonas salinaria]
MKRITIATSCATALGLLMSTAAIAQDEVDVLSTWSYDTLYAEGWSVENMFDETEIIDASGEDVGDVENVVFSNDGQVLGIIAQVGGFWDIGDTHVYVPWDEVTMQTGIQQIRIPVTEENVSEYDAFGSGWFDEEVISAEATDTTQVVNDDLVAGQNVFKATDLIGDYSYLQDNARYGYVSDLIVQDGALSAIMVDARASGRPGYFAYPYGPRANMNTMRYDMPYGQEQVDTIENFDYGQLESRISR